MATYLAYDFDCPAEHEIHIRADSTLEAKAIAARQGWTLYGKEEDEEVAQAMLQRWLLDVKLH